MFEEYVFNFLLFFNENIVLPFLSIFNQDAVGFNVELKVEI